MNCADAGAQTAAAQTQPVQGPGGAFAILKVSTADDHGKNSHDCEAQYQLLFTPAGASAPVVVDLVTSDAEYGRNLSLHLDGFSQDGKHIFGIFSEVGKYPTTSLFDFDTTSRQVQVIDLTKQFIGPYRCSTTFSVVGTNENRLIALELNSVNGCVPKRRFLLDPTHLKFQNLSQTTTILSLYKVESPADSKQSPRPRRCAVALLLRLTFSPAAL
jgi:hypothetical protein